MLTEGDIAMCIASGSPSVVGKTAMLRSEWNGTLGGFCLIIRPESKDLGRLISYWFRGPQFVDWRDNRARGANIQNLKASEIRELSIPLPPLAEQKRIVAELEAQTAAADGAKRAAADALNELRNLPGALLRQALAGELG